MATLHLFLFAGGHAVVAKVIEAELRVRAVSDVAVVLLAPDGGRLVMQDATHGQTEKFIDCAHPFRVTRREVIVDGHDMDAATGEGIEIDRQGAD